MSLNKLAKEKLVEKNIDWEQIYTDKTLYLKEQFEDVIGPGSYFRFEGQDKQSGSEYYCIVGPAKIKDPIAKFFAGVRKLPATYSAGGKYFDSLTEAANYAKETWGVPVPRSLRPYTSGQLHGIAGKVDKWKEERESVDDSKREEIEKEESKLTNKEASMNDFKIIEAAGKKKPSKKVPEQTIKTPSVNIPPNINPRHVPDKVADDIPYGGGHPSTNVNRQKPQGTPETLMEGYKDTMDVVPEDSEYNQNDLILELTDIINRETGIGYWDIRNTLFNVPSVEKKISISDVMRLVDVSDPKNPQIRGIKYYKLDGRDQAYIPMYNEETGRNKMRFVTRQVKRRFNQWVMEARGVTDEDLLRDLHGNDMEERPEDMDEPAGEEESKGAKEDFSIKDIDEAMGVPKYKGDSTSQPAKPLTDKEKRLKMIKDIVNKNKSPENPKSSSSERKKKVFTSVMKNLIKMAAEMDSKGNYQSAEEIHKVIRKYKEGIL